MSDNVIIAILAAIPPTLTAFAALVVSIFTRIRTKDQLEKATTKIEEIHVATNSMKDALVKSARLEGIAEGTKDEKGRAALERVASLSAQPVGKPEGEK